MFAAVARSGDAGCEGLPRCEAGPSVCGFGGDVAGAATCGFRRGADREYVWRYFVGSGGRRGGIAGAAGIGEYRRAGGIVRTGAWIGARYCGQRDRESVGSDSVGGDVIAAFVSSGTGGGVHRGERFGGVGAGKADRRFGAGARGDFDNGDGAASGGGGESGVGENGEIGVSASFKVGSCICRLPGSSASARISFERLPFRLAARLAFSRSEEHTS